MKFWSFILLLCVSQLVMSKPTGRLFETIGRGHVLYIKAIANYDYRNAAITMVSDGFSFECERPEGCRRMSINALSNGYYTAFTVKGPSGGGQYAFSLSLSNLSSSKHLGKSQRKVSAITVQTGEETFSDPVPLTNSYVSIPIATTSDLNFCEISGSTLDNCSSERGLIGIQEPFGSFYNVFSSTTSVLYVTTSIQVHGHSASIATCSFPDGTLSSIICNVNNYSITGGIESAWAFAVNTSTNQLYVTQLSSKIGVCDLSSAGQITDCTTFTPVSGDPFGFQGIATNPNNTYLYLTTDNSDSRIYQCPITSGTIGTCVNTNAANLNSPKSLSVSADGLYLYAACYDSNSNTNSVTTCPLSTGSVQGSSCTSTTDSTFDSPQSIGLSYTSTTTNYAYFANLSNDTISICPVSSDDITSCTAFSNIYTKDLTLVSVMNN